MFNAVTETAGQNLCKNYRTRTQKEYKPHGAQKVPEGLEKGPVVVQANLRLLDP